MTDPLIEQIQTEKDYFTKAKLLQYIIYDKQTRIIDLSKQLKIKPSYICHLIRLNKLDPMIIDGYYSKLISISHLFMISRLKTKQDMIKVYEKVLSHNLTVFQTEEEVREILYQVKTIGSSIVMKEQKKIESLLSDNIKNVKTHLIQTRVKAKIIIEIKGNLQETTDYIRLFVARLKLQKNELITPEALQEKDLE
ncbi:hypothetical protein COY87_04285 [Candidatus Roizmanbacteria bacterium CG_4_10_14_0_8_um_filter_33_9]|uniref:ParB/Spo0J HTH domain-containing protein n=1 Tax=Candidatus Roizmanbacteria bacterium CG_4_10_14_0_8_um_filter_33_9 TaxID=1974826 RepID=A0A2M7QII0_9BACT|nr:MAG: hypothetical protein COY87_04285 [Candidatus Roizmanbacteria bacterium CG_4_10_14_0_8_um_filter_33_9]